MKFGRADREIETLVREIRSNTLDLQPDFQRGEVWRVNKQQLLIDSILRGWYVPPIHVIDHEDTHLQEILDGQQRLRSIMNFVDGHFAVKGDVQPSDNKIQQLAGSYYANLPGSVQRAFMRFTITQYTLTDYKSAEPAELFFRLNQNMPLTPAETRNAFIGAIREQVKGLVAEMIQKDLDRESLGFSNSRMSFDDVVARLCIALERRTIAQKITARDLDERYRAGIPFSSNAITSASKSISALGDSREWWDEKVRFNKATLFSWLWFIAEAQADLPSVSTPQRLGTLLSSFERTRKSLDPNYLDGLTGREKAELLKSIVAIYNDRATSRVADVASVVLRDAALWVFAAISDPAMNQAVDFRRNSDELRRRISVGKRIASQPLRADELLNELLETYLSVYP